MMAQLGQSLAPRTQSGLTLVFSFMPVRRWASGSYVSYVPTGCDFLLYHSIVSGHCATFAVALFDITLGMERLVNHMQFRCFLSSDVSKRQSFCVPQGGAYEQSAKGNPLRSKNACEN